MNKYEVKDAVWIAAALMAADAYLKNPKVTRADMYFKQADIVRLAQKYANKTVDQGRVSWWVNADSRQRTQNYLRADLPEFPQKRRLSMMDEFPEKAYPTGLDMSDKLSIHGNEVTMEELFSFVREQYPLIMKQKSEIDYIGVLNYLENNQEVPYSNPDAEGLSADERARLLAVRQRGQDAVGRMAQMAAWAQKLFGFDKCLRGQWLDGSHTKTQRYLWTQMKYANAADDPISVSIFVERNKDSSAYYRISLEIKNDNADKEMMAKYHSHLDIPCNSDAGLIYISGSNEWDVIEKIEDTQDIIKTKVNSGELRKVQICKCIERIPGETNEYYHQHVMDAIQALLPYYDHVIGKSSEKKTMIDIDSINVEYDKNMILYGPPGTGKTYSSAMYAVAICDRTSIDVLKSMEYDDVMSRYRELLAEGRIALTTFHQSYGYEEFIEGIKPNLTADSDSLEYVLEDGVFKKFCDRAEAFTIKTTQIAPHHIWGMILGGNEHPEIKRQCIENEEVRLGWTEIADDLNGNEGGTEPGRRMVNYFINTMEIGDLVLIQKSIWNIEAIGVVSGDYDRDKEGRYPRRRSVKWLVKDIDQNIVKYLPEGGKQMPRQSLFALDYIGLDAIYEILEQNGVAVGRDTRPYVFIIDEINRGNISKIFGELITLLEPSKRKEMKEYIPAILPYSKDLFGVPKNVYLLGTMNTADRSIALMDTALRRRFQFIEMMPDADVLREILINGDKGKSLNVSKMLETINERITYLYDREHTIGHAYFMSLTESPTVETLAAIFQKSIIPLLQEYFYEDYQKIRLVLGDNSKDKELQFIQEEDLKARNVFKGNVDDAIDLPEKKYSLNKKAFMNLDSYIEIM